MSKQFTMSSLQIDVSDNLFTWKTILNFSWVETRYERVVNHHFKSSSVSALLTFSYDIFLSMKIFRGGDKQPHKCSFTLPILRLAIDILEYVLNWGEQYGKTGANHKRISCCVDWHGFISYNKTTIPAYKIVRVNCLQGRLEIDNLHLIPC